MIFFRCGSFSGVKNFGRAKNQKTCTHLKKYLGEEFEIARCNLPEKGKKEKIASHINISVLLAHKYQDGYVLVLLPETQFYCDLTVKWPLKWPTVKV